MDTSAGEYIEQKKKKKNLTCILISGALALICFLCYRYCATSGGLTAWFGPSTSLQS